MVVDQFRLELYRRRPGKVAPHSAPELFQTRDQSTIGAAMQRHAIRVKDRGTKELILPVGLFDLCEPESSPSQAKVNAWKAGDPGGSRTPNPQFRRLMLYPVELRGRGAKLRWSRARLADSPFDFGQGRLRRLSLHDCLAKKLGWETGIEPATVGATVRCSAS
jgi:hypothetical protein